MAGSSGLPGARGIGDNHDGGCAASVPTPSTSAEVATQSYRVCASGIGCSPSRRAERGACATLLPLCGLRGRVRMQGADCVLHYIHDRRAYGSDLARARPRCAPPAEAVATRTGSEGSEGSDAHGDAHNECDKDARAHDVHGDGHGGGGGGGDGDGMLVFGRELSRGSRKLLDRLALPQRRYLGATTMPPESALLAANLAAVSRGDTVLDPCCGSGGLLVACAVFGAVVFGADANSAVVR